jgi:hypothetical protein
VTDSVLTVISVYGLRVLLVAWQITTLPSGARGIVVSAGSGSGTSAAVTMSAAIQS